MNIHEAATSGKPFSNPSIIGAWMIIDRCLIHRDNVNDFRDIDWIRENCHTKSKELYWMDVDDLTRTDWFLIQL